jgi:cation/acetate symporter
MTMDGVPGLVALVVVSLATLAIGTYGLRISRTTSDFYVASRSVAPGLNASAIGGEYLSAASFLGVAALVLTAGAQMLWYPIGWTAGYLVLLVLVAAPLRRSGAYTLPDFAEARLGSRRVRALCSVLVVAIGWLYLLPQFQGAGLTLTAAVDAPKWVGALVVGAVVVVNVSSGGMRSITFVQAFQYWLKLTALLVPAAILLVIWAGDGGPDPTGGGAGWSMPLGEGNQGLYTTYSIVLATFLGTMGLPHVVVRFYTNPDGGAARRTTLAVLALLGVFYLLPPIYAVLGRAYGAEADDTVVLELPRLMLDGPSGDLLTGVVTAGAFAAFLSTSSGLAIAVSGVLAQDVLGGRMSGVTAFRAAATFAVGVPLAAAVLAPDLSVARAVGLAFAVAASTFCPLLVLGIWWRGLTPAGAVAGLLTGGLGSSAGVIWTLYDGAPASWSDVLLGQPAAWSVPLAFAAMVGVSLVTRETVPGHASRFMVRLHTPEVVQVDRG